MGQLESNQNVTNQKPLIHFIFCLLLSHCGSRVQFGTVLFHSILCNCTTQVHFFIRTVYASFQFRSRHIGTVWGFVEKTVLYDIYEKSLRTRINSGIFWSKISHPDFRNFFPLLCKFAYKTISLVHK